MRPKIENSVPGQVLISIGVVVTVAAIIVGNMPDSALKSSLGNVTEPFLNITGLYQNWAVFAAPRTLSGYVDGRVDNSDGTSTVYPIRIRRGIAAPVDYRWHKYEEAIRPDDGQQLWPAYAEYLAERARADGHDPVRVTLIRRWSDTLRPGPGPERGPWHEAVMGVFPVGGTP